MSYVKRETAKIGKFKRDRYMQMETAAWKLAVQQFKNSRVKRQRAGSSCKFNSAARICALDTQICPHADL